MFDFGRLWLGSCRPTAGFLRRNSDLTNSDDEGLEDDFVSHSFEPEVFSSLNRLAKGFRELRLYLFFQVRAEIFEYVEGDTWVSLIDTDSEFQLSPFLML